MPDSKAKSITIPQKTKAFANVSAFQTVGDRELWRRVHCGSPPLPGSLRLPRPENFPCSAVVNFSRDREWDSAGWGWPV